MNSLKSIGASTINTMGNLLLSPPYGGFGNYYNHGSRNSRRIALTFDDGPSKPSTELLLDTLAELNVKATFFCIGLNVTWHADVLARTYVEGHVIGNHSMWHSRKAGLLPVGGSHIDTSANEIAQVIGVHPRLYRPPWGWLTPWEAHRLRSRGYAIIGWDVYPPDWKVPEVSASDLSEFVYKRVRPGSIVLYHDARSNLLRCEKTETPRSLRQLVPRLRDEGYDFVTVPELLGLPAYRLSRAGS
jgi:peptidoglycan/xylan/chitin deacetylase (PgdA/CDA1 family)